MTDLASAAPVPEGADIPHSVGVLSISNDPDREARRQKGLALREELRKQAVEKVSPNEAQNNNYNNDASQGVAQHNLQNQQQNAQNFQNQQNFQQQNVPGTVGLNPPAQGIL